MSLVRRFKSRAPPTHGKKQSADCLAEGLFVDLSSLAEDDLVGREALWTRAIHQAGLKPPIIITFLKPLKDLDVVLPAADGEPERALSADPRVQKVGDKLSRILVQASTIADITMVHNVTSMSLGGQSVLRVNAEFPVYLWFKAANMQLALRGLNVRLVPFPVVQPKPDGELPPHAMDMQDEILVFQSIRATVKEYDEYSDILESYIRQDGLEKGFAGASRYGYKILNSRSARDALHSGEEFTIDEYREHCTPILLRRDSQIRGVIVFGETDGDFEDKKELRERFGVFV